MRKLKKEIEKLIKYIETWKDDSFPFYENSDFGKPEWTEGYWVFHEFYKRLIKIKELI